MRRGLEQLAIPHTLNSGGVITLSAGLAMLDPAHTRSVGEVIKEADMALYRAKELGRNRVDQLLPLTPPLHQYLPTTTSEEQRPDYPSEQECDR